jgi:hypothetical protein
MEQESTYGQMEPAMKDSGKITKLQGTDIINGQMGANT